MVNGLKYLGFFVLEYWDILWFLGIFMSIKKYFFLKYFFKNIFDNIIEKNICIGKDFLQKYISQNSLGESRSDQKNCKNIFYKNIFGKNIFGLKYFRQKYFFLTLPPSDCPINNPHLFSAPHQWFFKLSVTQRRTKSRTGRIHVLSLLLY